MTFLAFEMSSRLITAPPDPNAHQRAARLQQLGLGYGQRIDPNFDEFARRLAKNAGAPICGVNFIDETQQYFAGMHAGGDPTADVAAAPLPPQDPSRVMPREQGYCPHVLARAKALVLEDVCDYPRFAGDPSVDDMGVRSYMAAPMIDHTGTVLGTVCAADVDVHRWGRPGLAVIKSMAAEVVAYVQRREGLR